MYFATTSARTTAIGSVTVEGMVTYIPANGLEYYNGTAWTAVSNPGDITDVLAGKGLTGGGTSGSVTLALGTTAKGDLVAGSGTTTAAALTVGANNTVLQADSTQTTGLKYSTPAAVVGNIVTAKGDLIAATASGAVSNLAVGSNNQVLTADSTAATGIKWATPSAGGATFSGVSIWNSVATTVNSATLTTLTFDGENYDTDGFHSTSSNTSRITVPAGKAGYYQINFQIGFTANATGQRYIKLLKNGTTTLRYTNWIGLINLDNIGMPMTFIANLAVGDYIEIQAYQNSGTTNSVVTRNNDEQMIFQATYMGA
jgi:hypothetical protein